MSPTMRNSTVLIVIGDDAPLSELSTKLETLRPLSARAIVLILGEIPVFPYYASGMPLYGTTDVPLDWQSDVAEKKAAVEARAKEVEALLQQHGVSGEVSAAACEPPKVAELVARHAMLCDLVLVGHDLRQRETLFQQSVFGVLFQSPVAALLNDPDAIALNGPRRVFVAWNSHVSSARAVHLALPLLRAAEEVIVGTVDPVKTEFREGEDPGVDVAKWLTHHGCKVTVQQYPSGGQDVGQCILDRSNEAGAELIVMGSYGHSRMRQAIFGGTTRTMIEQTGQAVLLAH